MRLIVALPLFPPANSNHKVSIWVAPSETLLISAKSYWDLETAGVSGLPGSTAAPTDLIGTVNNTLIGTSSGGAAEYSVTLAGGSVTLNAATDYALIIDTFGIGGSSASVNWQYTYTSDSAYFTTVDGSGFSGAWNRANKSPFAWNQTGTGTQALMVLGAAGLLISVRRQRKNLLQISDGNGRNHRK